MEIATAFAAGWLARAAFGWWRRSRVDADGLALAMLNAGHRQAGLPEARHLGLIVGASGLRAYAAEAIRMLRP